jgi:hypothetical protein
MQKVFEYWKTIWINYDRGNHWYFKMNWRVTGKINYTWEYVRTQIARECIALCKQVCENWKELGRNVEERMRPMRNYEER